MNGAQAHNDSAGGDVPTHNGTATALAVGAPLTFDPDYRSEVHTAEDTIDVETYGGGFDLTRRATAPKLRVGRDKWFNLLWLLPIGFAMLVAAVAIGKGLYHMPAVHAFIQRYPAPTPEASSRASRRGSAGPISSICS
ncbi:hypothetical protein I553_6594 [Mycobacterium xenopi 4042]|uniref:Uncharacterized protein n=1 Tax=Mycobacterium xenopi 4042 TaxID=1299334 RepID=X8BFU3_MYCXE|nr:hypothetical protein I552_6194 [Mycobacterium xenopi 3993]EUA42734.1 hypothetical protein I553_6594 [Mycobacterium xenopi 4042]